MSWIIQIRNLSAMNCLHHEVGIGDLSEVCEKKSRKKWCHDLWFCSFLKTWHKNAHLQMSQKKTWCFWSRNRDILCSLGMTLNSNVVLAASARESVSSPAGVTAPEKKTRPHLPYNTAPAHLPERLRWTIQLLLLFLFSFIFQICRGLSAYCF